MSRPESPPDERVRPAESGEGEPAEASGAPEPRSPKRGKRRRAGRLRRFVLRPLVWGGALFLLLFAGLFAFVQSSFARSRVAALVTARLSDALGRPVRLRDARIGLLPLDIELYDLVIPGRNKTEPPFAEVPRLRIQVSWRALRQQVLDLEQIEALGPTVRLDFAADGSTNLPTFGAGGGGGRSRFKLSIDRVLVQHGTLVLNERILPLSLDARGVWGRLSGPSPERLAALATAQDVAVLLPGAQTYHLTASLKGLIEPAKVTIETVRLAGPDLSVQGDGRYTWAKGKYRFDLNATGTGDATLVGRLGYLADPLSGRFTFAGKVEVTPGSYGWQADVAAPTVFYGATGEPHKREIREVSAHAVGKPESVDISIERARYAEGNVAGQVIVDLTQSGPAKPIAIDLDFDQLDVARFLAAEGLDLAVASRGAGSFVYRAKANDLVGGNGDITVRLAAAAGGGKNGPLPVGGDLPLRLERGVLSSPGYRLTAQSVTAEGTATYDLERSIAQVSARLATSDLATAVRLIPSAPEPEIWRPTSGRGTAQIDLNLQGGKAATAIGFDLSGVAAPALVADRLAGSFTWIAATGAENTPKAQDSDRIEDLHAEARRGDALLSASGRIPLGPGAGPPLALNLEVQSWPAAEIARLAADLTAKPGVPKTALPELLGRLSGTLSLGGSFAVPTGRADLAVEGLAVSSYPLGHATAAVAFGADRIQVERLVLTTAAGELAGSGRIDRLSGVLALGVEAPDLDLSAEPFASLLGGQGTGSDLAGRGSVHASVSGTLSHPEATVTALATGLTLDGRPLAKGGASQLVANWDGEAIEAHGSLLGLATFAGGGRLDTKGADVDFSVESANLKNLVEIATQGGAGLPEISGSFAGRARLGADFAAGTYRAEVELPKLDALLAGRRLKNLEPIVLRLSSDRVEIASLYLAEEATGSDLFAAGTIGLGAGPKPLDLKVQSTIAASWLGLFVSGIDVAGYLDAIATVKGTLDRPAIRGEGEIRDAHLILPEQAIGLEEMAGTILFNRDQIVLDNLRARVGAGTLRASGRVSVPASGAEISYSFQAIADRISLRFPEGFLSRGDAQISIASTREGRQVAGEIRLDRAFYLDDVAVGTLELLSSAFRRERLEVEESDPALASTALNLRVLGPGALRVRNNVADLRGDIDLAIRGNAARPVVFGAVEIAEGGKLIYADNEYRVERGRVTFDNPNRIDPVIDLTAKTEVRNYEIALDLSGTVDRLTAHFRSEDGLADLDVLSLLATGRELEPGSSELGLATSTTTTAPGTGFAAEFLASQAASAVSKRVQNLFGFDRFRIDPLAGGSGSISNVQLTVGKRLSKKLFVTYTTTPSASETTVLQAEWQVGKNVVILFTSNGSDRYSVDVQWEKRR